MISLRREGTPAVSEHRKYDIFYYDDLNDIVVPLAEWVRAVGWAPQLSGGSQEPPVKQIMPFGYHARIWKMYLHLLHNPNLDNLPLFYNMRPTEDKVLIRPLPTAEKTEKGIVIPDSIREKSLRGEVVAVGPGRYNPNTGTTVPMNNKVGDIVAYNKFAGTEMLIDSVPHLIMRERDILLTF